MGCGLEILVVQDMDEFQWVLDLLSHQLQDKCSLPDRLAQEKIYFLSMKKYERTLVAKKRPGIEIQACF